MMDDDLCSAHLPCACPLCASCGRPVDCQAMGIKQFLLECLWFQMTSANKPNSLVDVGPLQDLPPPLECNKRSGEQALCAEDSVMVGVYGRKDSFSNMRCMHFRCELTLNVMLDNHRYMMD